MNELFHIFSFCSLGGYSCDCSSEKAKSLTERNWPSVNPALCFLRGPRVGPRRRSAYRGKAAIFSLGNLLMAYRGFFPADRHAAVAWFPRFNESSAATFELSLAICARRA